MLVWVGLGCPGLLSTAMICSGPFWSALGCSRLLWAVRLSVATSSCSGLLWATHARARATRKYLLYVYIWASVCASLSDLSVVIPASCRYQADKGPAAMQSSRSPFMSSEAHSKARTSCCSWPVGLILPTGHTIDSIRKNVDSILRLVGLKLYPLSQYHLNRLHSSVEFASIMTHSYSPTQH